MFKAAARAQVSALEIMTHEDVDIGLDGSYVEVLSDAPKDWRLRRLGLRYGNLYDSAEQLTKARCLERLEVLDMRYNRLDDDELSQFVSAPWGESLRELYLQGNRIREDGAVALACASGLKSLRWLDLRDNAIGAKGATALSQAKHLASLEWLALYRADVEPAGVRALAESKHLAPEICRYWRGLLG